MLVEKYVQKNPMGFHLSGKGTVVVGESLLFLRRREKGFTLADGPFGVTFQLKGVTAAFYIDDR